MARRQISRNLYERLLTAYRDKPGNHSNAARFGGCDRRMAKRAWERGWDYAPQFTPIEQALGSEQAEARSLRVQSSAAQYIDAEAAASQARQDAVQARVQEGQMVKLARGSSTAVLAQAARALKASNTLVHFLEQELPNLDGMTAVKALSVLDRISKLASQAQSIAHTTMRMERLHMGEAEATVEINHNVGPLSNEDLLRELREIDSTLRVAAGAYAEEAETITVNAQRLAVEGPAGFTVGEAKDRVGDTEVDDPAGPSNIVKTSIH